MAEAGRDRLLRLPCGSDQPSGVGKLPAPCGQPLAALAAATQPAQPRHLGSDGQAYRRLAPPTAHPSSLAAATLRRQTPEVGAVCGNAARTICAGAPGNGRSYRDHRLALGKGVQGGEHDGHDGRRRWPGGARPPRWRRRASAGATPADVGPAQAERGAAAAARGGSGAPIGDEPPGLALHQPTLRRPAGDRVWGTSRATVYRHRRGDAPLPRRRPGPCGPMPDVALAEAIRQLLADSPFTVKAIARSGRGCASPGFAPPGAASCG
jgi:hypothetical protein